MLKLALTKDLERVGHELPDFFEREATRAGEIATREIAQRTPVGRRINAQTGADEGPSGHLKASWRPIPVRVHAGTYTSGSYTLVEYAPYVEYDTRRHIIPTGGPEAGIVLHFFSHGEEIFTRSVHHPGTRGKYMMTRGLNATERIFLPEAERRLQLLIDGGVGR